MIVITIDVSLFKQLTTNRKLISRRIRNHFGEKHQKDEDNYIYTIYIRYMYNYNYYILFKQVLSVHWIWKVLKIDCGINIYLLSWCFKQMENKNWKQVATFK